MSDFKGEIESVTLEIVTSHMTDHIISESLFTDGELSSIHRPAYREFDETTGRLKLERWMTNGIRHRYDVDKPSETIWDDATDNIKYQAFMDMGKYHRDHHRPARIWYSAECGNIIKEEFWFKGQIHRGNGLPAILEYDAYGKVVVQEFYQLGQKIMPPSIAPKP